MNSSQKIPGYAGHIPFKGEYFGLTTGNLNRVAEESYKTVCSPKGGF